MKNNIVPFERPDVYYYDFGIKYLATDPLNGMIFPCLFVITQASQRQPRKDGSPPQEIMNGVSRWLQDLERANAYNPDGFFANSFKVWFSGSHGEVESTIAKNEFFQEWQKNGGDYPCKFLFNHQPGED